MEFCSLVSGFESLSSALKIYIHGGVSLFIRRIDGVGEGVPVEVSTAKSG